MLVAVQVLMLAAALPPSSALGATRDFHHGLLAPAQQLAASVINEAAPAEVSSAIKPLLADTGVRVAAGQPGSVTLDFWWVKAIPLAQPSARAAATWDEVEEGTLIGVVRLSARYTDIRGSGIKPGVYTLRFGLQPQNGDHLGTSPNREFLLLGPAAADTDPAPKTHDAAVDLAKQTLGIAHPAIWSLDPPTTDAAPQSVKRDEEMNLSAIVFEIPVTSKGQPAGKLRFALVLLGKIEA
jgi:hypothetical protein